MTENKKELLFSLTKKDFDVQFFRAGGKGGQKQNKTSSACRITHPESGAVGECRNHREQHLNKKEAFRRLIDSTRFKAWLKIKTSRVYKTEEEIERWVDKMMRPENLKIEPDDVKEED